MLTNISASGQRIADVYSDTIDMLAEKGYNRPEAIAGLLSLIAVQIVGATPEVEKLDAFIKAACEYTVLFFGAAGNDSEVIH